MKRIRFARPGEQPTPGTKHRDLSWLAAALLAIFGFAIAYSHGGGLFDHPRPQPEVVAFGDCTAGQQQIRVSVAHHPDSTVEVTTPTGTVTGRAVDADTSRYVWLPITADPFTLVTASIRDTTGTVVRDSVSAPDCTTT